MDPGSLAGGQLRVTVSAIGGTATSGVDFTGLPTNVTITVPPGLPIGATVEKTFSVNITPDALVEGDETVTLQLSGPVVLACPGGLCGTIIGVTSIATLKILDAPPANGAAERNGPVESAREAVRTFAALSDLALLTARVQATNIGLRLAALRRGQQYAFAPQDFTLKLGEDRLLLASVAPLVPSPKRDDVHRVGVFLTGEGSFGERSATGPQAGFDFHTAGTTLGVDYRLTEHVILGVAAGYGSTAADISGSRSELRTRGGNGSIFGTYYVNGRFFVDGIITYGQYAYETRRDIPDVGGIAKGDTGGHEVSVTSSSGYTFTEGPLSFGPTLKLTYITATVNRFKERGADAYDLRVATQDPKSLTNAVGANITYTIKTGWAVIAPGADVAWEHEFEERTRTNVQLVNDPSAAFSGRGDPVDHDYVNLGAGVVATLRSGAGLFIRYETVLGRDHLSEHRLAAGFRVAF